MPRILLQSMPLMALVAGIPGIALAAIGGPPPEMDPSGKPKTSGPVLEVPGLTGRQTVRAVKWDYFENPVRSSSPSSRPEDFVFGTIPLFDGYPARVSQPSIRIY